MSSRSWIIGSSSQCDICVQSATVSGTHCRLTERGESFLLEDLQSSNGVFVEGEQITAPRFVRRGERVTLGKTVPLPWPATVTIGRLPDNNVVINLETVSGHHACLEHEENRVYLVDLGSTNGTAINDPLNKITRADLQPRDFVFFGAHRMSASELFSRLPRDPARQATALEQPSTVEQPGPIEQPRHAELAPPVVPLAELRELEPAVSAAPSTTTTLTTHSLGSWLGGIAISAVVVVVLFGGARLLRSPAREADSTTKETTDDPSSPSPSPLDDAPVPIPAPAVLKIPAPPNEKMVRQSEGGVALVGARVGDTLFFTNVSTTCWVCGSSEMICPTSILDDLSDALKKKNLSDQGLIVCTPRGAIAIEDYRKGVGDAAGFSIAKLESPLEQVCPTRTKAADFNPVKDQKLAVLVAESKNDDPSTITRRFAPLTVIRVNRGSDKLPLMIVCAADSELILAAGAPVFDNSGDVVGCVLSFDDTSRKVEVTPLSRLISILPHVP